MSESCESSLYVLFGAEFDSEHHIQDILEAARAIWLQVYGGSKRMQVGTRMDIGVKRKTKAVSSGYRWGDTVTPQMGTAYFLRGDEGGTHGMQKESEFLTKKSRKMEINSLNAGSLLPHEISHDLLHEGHEEEGKRFKKQQERNRAKDRQVNDNEGVGKVEKSMSPEKLFTLGRMWLQMNCLGKQCLEVHCLVECHKQTYSWLQMWPNLLIPSKLLLSCLAGMVQRSWCLLVLRESHSY